MVNFLSNPFSRAVNDKDSVNPVIKVEELTVSKNRLLLFKLSYPKEIKKYFSSNVFWVKYDRDVQNVSASILQIPVLSNLIPLAWTIGADICVKELDNRYLESINKVKSVMKGWYPKLPFSTNIIVENIASNSFANNGHGLLFSGGVDSTASYIRNRGKKPNLIMVWGADIPLDKEEFWEKVKNTYREFADQENVKINFIESNMRDFMNQRLINAQFGGYFSFWAGLHHAIGLLGLCAPITVTEQIRTVLVAASATKEFRHPWGSDPRIDNKISWADVKVVHDSYDLSRQEKIRYLFKDFVEQYKRYPLLRVCYSQHRDFNCSTCEKCSRTIAGLVLENIDPNKCGFNIDSNFFDFFKENLIQKRVHLDEGGVFLLTDIQKHIPKTMGHSLHGCKEFFTWFKDFDISGNAHKTSIGQFLLRIYYELPENVQNAILGLPRWLRMATDINLILKEVRARDFLTRRCHN